MLDDMESRFYGALGVVPDVPADMYRKIIRRVRRGSLFSRAALAACLALAVGVGFTAFLRFGSPSAAYAESLNYDGIFYAFEYLNGDVGDNYPFTDKQISFLSGD